MKIRDAETKDTEKLDALFTKLIREEAQYDISLNRSCAIKDNYTDRIGADGHKLILIEIDEEIVGYLYGFILDIPEIYNAPIAILDALFIEEKHRRNGYASRLIAEFRAFAAQSGAARIELKVLSDNKHALELYRKLSFAETKKYMRLEL